MTEEADARARLLAHYENRLSMLAGKLEVVEAELLIDHDRPRAIALKSRGQRLRSELTDVREKALRLMKSMGMA